MAKVSLTKLGLKLNQENKIVEWNGQMIEVKQYLPVNDKLMLISNVINLSHDSSNYSNPLKNDVYFGIELINFYTNINITEKQQENPTKLYDNFLSSGLYETIINAIPTEEYSKLYNDLQKTIKAIYAYKNSILGILDVISSDYDNLDLDISKIQEAVENPNNLGLLKDIVSKMNL